MASNNPRATILMRDGILPISQYVAYLEVGRDGDPMALGTTPRKTDLWRASEGVADADRRFAMRRVHHRREIYPVFRELFRKRAAREKAGQACADPARACCSTAATGVSPSSDRKWVSQGKSVRVQV